MEIEIIGIGSELLKGRVVNTNAAYISSELLKAGYNTVRHSVLPDIKVPLKQGLESALSRNEIVITTGGLGPTCDDMTKYIAAELFDSEFTYDDEVAADLIKRYGSTLLSLQEQSTVPVKAYLLKNRYGTAPGFVFKTEKSILAMLPGVPAEMKIMFAEQLLPYLKKNKPSSLPYYSKQLYFFDVVESQVDPILREINAEFSDVELGVYPAPGMISITLSSFSSTDKTNELESLAEKIVSRFKDHQIESPEGDYSQAVKQLFCDRKLSLSTAESCTGGAIAAKIVQTPGSSGYYQGSVVAYSNELKEKLLNVPDEVINEHGAVSEETVKHMLQGLLAITHTDYGIAVSGVSGPDGGTERVPVGTIWIAMGKKGSDPIIRKFIANGTRDYVIAKTVTLALGYLWKLVKA